MKTKLFFAAVAVAFTACIACGAERVRYVDRQFQECYVDAAGFQRCRMVTKTVAVVESDGVPDAKAVPVTVASSPVVPQTVYVTRDVHRVREVLFPRVRAFFARVSANRPRLVFFPGCK
jgi:hypothetical protein